MLEFVGATFTEMTYSAAFSYLEYEKEYNFFWVLPICRDLLKSTDNLPKGNCNWQEHALMNNAEVF